MTLPDLLAQVHLGEDSTRQFKADLRNAESLAAELAAFANSEGGTLFLGVADDGSLPGLDRDGVSRLNQLIGNAASQLVRSPLVVSTENVALDNGRLVIAVRVPRGLDKPYFDKNGVIWLKVGSDKRRVNSKEELRRFFQITDQFHADELPTRAGLDALDLLRFRDFLRDVYDQALPDAPGERLRLLQNLNLATEDGVLNLAGLLLFGEQPERFKPQFTVKAARYLGNRVETDQYADMEDFHGPLRKVYDDVLGFVLRNLHKVQAGRGVNAPGVPEIPVLVFEELLVNALVHRDYLLSAPVRVFVFDDRVEILSPGHLPDHLTVAKLRAGNSNIRNPILASFVAKGVLPYRGLGSGVRRALAAWPRIDFSDDRDDCQFTATVRRDPASVESSEELATGSEESSEELATGSEELATGSVESSEELATGSVEPVTPSGKDSTDSLDPDADTRVRILAQLSEHPSDTISDLASALGLSTRAIEKQIARLQERGQLRRIGPKKGGRWQVLR